MDTILPVMLVVAMIATAAVLFVGVISFAVGGKATQKYATKLMAARVICQGWRSPCSARWFCSTPSDPSASERSPG
ncbi:MAG: HIG1 domain-containing protein [Defluviicoccus sp.]|nr:MAG: HIG1 domain-containing protein [Defluviicoccus sp.]